VDGKTFNASERAVLFEIDRLIIQLANK